MEQHQTPLDVIWRFLLRLLQKTTISIKPYDFVISCKIYCRKHIFSFSGLHHFLINKTSLLHSVYFVLWPAMMARKIHCKVRYIFISIFCSLLVKFHYFFIYLSNFWKRLTSPGEAQLQIWGHSPCIKRGDFLY